MAASPFFLTPAGTSVSFTSADTTVAKNVSTFGTLGGKLFSLSFVSTSSSAQVMQVFRRVSSTNFLMAEISVPANAGIGGAAAAEWVSPAILPSLSNMPALLDGIPFSPNDGISVAAKTTIASGTVTVSSITGQG